MKKLSCEVCGGSLVKNGDIFTCEFCGCKYLLEDVQRMLVEGTVSIDKSKETENSFINGKREFEDSNWDSAKPYFDYVIAQDPSNYLARFCSTYCALRSALMSNNEFERKKYYQPLSKLILSLKDHYSKLTDGREQWELLDLMYKSITGLKNEGFTYTKVTGNYGIKLSHNKSETEIPLEWVICTFVIALDDLSGYDYQPRIYSYMHDAARLIRNRSNQSDLLKYIRQGDNRSIESFLAKAKSDYLQSLKDINFIHYTDHLNEEEKNIYTEIESRVRRLSEEKAKVLKELKQLEDSLGITSIKEEKKQIQIDLQVLYGFQKKKKVMLESRLNELDQIESETILKNAEYSIKTEQLKTCSEDLDKAKNDFKEFIPVINNEYTFYRYEISKVNEVRTLKVA